jgi:epoxyqueuosine reductase
MDRISSKQLKEVALSLGFDSVGVAAALPVHEAVQFYRHWLNAGFDAEMEYLAKHEPLKADPRTLLEGAQSVIVVSLNYYQNPEPREGKVARYALGRDYHKVIPARLRKLVGVLEQEYPRSQHRICVDSAPLFDRAYAAMAGLGWFGKNTMLIDSKRGSWFFIGVVLSSIAFELDTASVGGCGTCRSCIDACPTGAIVKLHDRWAVNSGDCISYQTIEKRGELTTDTHGWLFGCDVCQEVCPFNQGRDSQPLRASVTPISDFYPRNLPTVDAIETMSEAEWDESFRGSAMRRTGYEGLRRNVRALRNEKK